MISRLKISAIVAAALLAPAIVHAQALLGAAGAGSASNDPVAFCCQTTSSQSGTGCYAVPSGTAGIAACSNIYLDCGADFFTCTPPAAAKAAVLGGSANSQLKSCTCSTPFINSL
ncbi:MAG TPA: hypothetical protein VMA09_07975 [Candidatus Binataceae bacterium]|nr:hypothetical protein [Candidatus Binataceae bacterium]